MRAAADMDRVVSLCISLSGRAGSPLATSTTWWRVGMVKASVQSTTQSPAESSLGLARARLAGWVS